MYRVTEILDGMLEKEFISYIENNSKAKRKAIQEEAFRVGSLVDKLIQDDINDGGYLVPEGDEPVVNCLKAWEAFKKDYPLFVPSVKNMQEEISSGDVVGHYDFYIERDGEWGICDLKCASSIRPKYWTQTAQYSEMKHPKSEESRPRFIAVLRLDKVSGLYEYKEIADETYIRYEVEVFKAYALAYSHNTTNREKMRFIAEEVISMSIFHRTALLACPGAGKSTAGLSYPGVEQHVFGSSEEDTALNFPDRKDILPPVKLDWFDRLTDTEKAKFTDEKASEDEIAKLTRIARAKNIARYRRYLYSIKADLLAGKRPELKTIFLDNGTPFAQDFEDYVFTVFANEFVTEKGNFNSIKYSMKYQSELTDFWRLFFSLPCHTVMSFHIAMALDEAEAAKSNFLKDVQQGITRQKEWQPLIYGKARYALAGIPTWAFYMWVEQNPGHPNKFLAKLESDDSNIGVAKGRVNPFEKAGRIEIPKGNFYEFLNNAIETKLKGGK